MKSETFLRIIGDIDDDLITEAAQTRRTLPPFVRIAGGIAACLMIAAAVVIAVPLLRHSARDAAAPEAEYTYSANCKDDADGAYDILCDEAVNTKPTASAGGSAGGVSPAETEAASAIEADTTQKSTADIGTIQPLMGWNFYFYDGKTWRTDTKTYPGGVPSMQGIVNDYLAAAGSSVRCTAAHSEVAGEKDEVKNGIVTHTVGVRTWYITLDGGIDENLHRGLVNTVLESAVPSPQYLVQVQTPAKTFTPTQASSLK